MNSPLVFDAHTEDLLVKYFDGALSVAEEQEFSLLRAAMPTLEAEIHRIRAFDTFLDGAHLTETREEELDTAFLWDMQKRFAQALAVGTVLATPHHNSQLTPEPTSPNDQSPVMAGQQEAASTANTTALNTTVSQSLPSAQAAIISSGGVGAAMLKTSFLVKTLAVTLFAGSVAYGVWRFVGNTVSEGSNGNENMTAPSTQATPQQSPTTMPSAEPRADANAPGVSQPNGGLSPKPTPAQPQPNTATNVAPPTPPQAIAQTNEFSAADSKRTLANEAKTEAKTDATANAQISTSNDKFRRDAEELTKKIQAKEQSGDLIGAAFVLKQLGFLQRTNGDAAAAMQSFSQALKTAQSQNVRELEAELLGELALVYTMQGNTSKAQTLLKTCTDILSEVNSKRLERWAKELRRLEGK